MAPRRKVLQRVMKCWGRREASHMHVTFAVDRDEWPISGFVRLIPHSKISDFH
jgi:hypothetical protein